ncbi:MAG: NnrS family protein [Gammaproteobacteria bacterium]
MFFPAAAAYGLVAVPLSVHGMLSGHALLPGFANVSGHAHELLFGFALAVVAGFLITRISPVRLGALFALWLVARASFLVFPDSIAAVTANAMFAFVLAALVSPQFLKSAKKLRNKALAPLLIALCLAAVVFQLGGATAGSGLQFLALREAVLLFALLMLFMGGRIIAPAAAGAIQRGGGHLEARVQPRIEGALLIVMTLAIVAMAVPGGAFYAGVLVLAAALLSLVRLVRWRLWACRTRPDLWCLGIGYLWLVIGLALLGASWSFQLLPASTATHAVTLGALGTLTTTVMTRVRAIRNKADPARVRTLPWITGIISLATLARLSGSNSITMLGVAAMLWSLALLLLLVALLRIPSG